VFTTNGQELSMSGNAPLLLLVTGVARSQILIPPLPLVKTHGHTVRRLPLQLSTVLQRLNTDLVK